MKRLEQEPTPEVLAESIEQDEVGRNDELVDFIRLLHETEGPFSLLLDARWGEGKTFFVKSAELVLNVLNNSGANLPAEKGSLFENFNSDGLKPVTEKLGAEQVSILPFYFNAWENDFAEDPMSALFACMAVAFGQEGLTKETNVGKAVAAATGILPLVPKTGFQSLVTALSSDDLVGAYRKRSELRERIDFLAENALPEVANKLVIFIDELDRCRPDFAVKLLEQTKALFQNERVIVVTVADSIQLAHAVAGQYGNGFDSTRFLDRFFDRRLRLEHVDPCEVIDKTHMLGSSDMLENYIGRIVKLSATSPDRPRWPS
ncbi:MAG: P-loop NTPase fold protein, partial [Atopobiaceae bacterium]